MGPLAVAALLAVAGGGAAWAYERWKKSQTPAVYNPIPGALPANMVTGGLTTGKSYYALVQTSPASYPGKDPTQFASDLAAGLTQVQFVPLGPPQVRTPQDTTAFVNGQPSQWAVAGRWQGANNTKPSALPAYIAGLNFYELPTTS